MSRTYQVWEATEHQLAAGGPLLERMRAEYLEMPGLQLTVAQARRLWALDGDTCAALLNALVEQRFLIRTPRGYRRPG
jgi:hypothetical protein